MKKIFKAIAFLAILLSAGNLFAQTPSHQPYQMPLPQSGEGYWSMYTKKNAGGSCLLKLPASNLNYFNLTAYNNTNDEISSLYLVGGAGMVKFKAIRLWDNSKKSYGDDWIEIILLRDLSIGEQILVPDLERSYQNGDVLVTYHRRDNLNGKVSSLEAKQTFFIDNVARPLPAEGSFWRPWGG